MTTLLKWLQSFFAFLTGKTQKEIENLQAHLAKSQERVEILSKYQDIIDAKAEAKRILESAMGNSERIYNEAYANSAKITEEATKELRSAKNEAERWRNEADAYAKQVKSESKKTLADASTKGKQIVNDANDKAGKLLRDAQSNANTLTKDAEKRAEEIGGAAYYALKEAKTLEGLVLALRNTVEGYGNRYLVPSYSVLDELADELAFTEAAERLKQLRELVRNMTEKRTAAESSYVEENRKTTAIDFITDAFNGKVDSILASLKQENIGTLEQKIRNAYALVNYNGKAFRDTKIREDYLNIRLQELKWSAALIELKNKEREEQRAIKDRIREEEKARKDFEKAQRDAQKEEETIKKAIEKARKEAEKASENQKELYEAKLQELLGKLQDAEAKNKRALSMAQQTKAGHVYIISNIGSFGEEVYKIGMTRRLEPLDRVKELGDASVPFEFDVHALIYSEDAPALENQLHKLFFASQVNKVNPRKEFFRVPLLNIKEEIDKLGTEVKWTMAALAREYRETLSIEESIKNDETQRNVWLQHQIKTMETEPLFFEEDMDKEDS